MATCEYYEIEDIYFISNNIGQHAKKPSSSEISICNHPNEGETKYCVGGSSIRCGGDTTSAACNHR